MPSERDKTSENPYEPPREVAGFRKRSPTFREVLVTVLVLIAVAGILAALLLPPVVYR